MRILLTDEEIKDICANPQNYLESMGDFDITKKKLIAKAQAKKILEWLISNNNIKDEPWSDAYTAAYGYEPMEDGDLFISKNAMQELKKEIAG